MNISLDQLIKMITREVIKELGRQGIQVDPQGTGVSAAPPKRSLELDMSEFKTPVLTENSFWNIGQDIKELIVPAKTVITPGAAREIKLREITIIYN